MILPFTVFSFCSDDFWCVFMLNCSKWCWVTLTFSHNATCVNSDLLLSKQSVECAVNVFKWFFPISTCCHNSVSLSPIMLQQAQYCTIIKANNVCLTFSTMFHCFFVPQIITFIGCHRLCKCWSGILDLLITGILYESAYGDTDLPSTWRAVCKTESVLRWVVYVDSAALYIAQILISTPPLAMM